MSKNKANKYLRQAVFKRDGYKCLLCKSTMNLTIDHIKPVSRDGQTVYENLQTLCRDCNEEKGSRHKIQMDYRENKTGRALRDLKLLERQPKKRCNKFFK